MVSYARNNGVFFRGGSFKHFAVMTAVVYCLFELHNVRDWEGQAFVETEHRVRRPGNKKGCYIDVLDLKTHVAYEIQGNMSEKVLAKKRDVYKQDKEVEVIVFIDLNKVPQNFADALIYIRGFILAAP